MKNNIEDDNLNYLKSLGIEFFISGSVQKQGVYVCKNCGQKLFLENTKILPVCKKCGSCIFTKD